MTIPPPLTWMCLLPRDVAYQCAECPSWFREAVAAQGIPGGRRVLISWGTSARSPDVSSLDGWVAVNDGAVVSARLREGGLNHIRRFAVLPNIERPRWFIPLDRPAVSAAAFDLYKPVRWQAHLKHWSARTAARLGRRIWYRDEVCVALRAPSPLETLLRDALVGEGKRREGANDDLRLAISSGNVESVRNRKLSMAALDRRGAILGFGKLSLSALSRHRVQREARALAALAALPQAAPAPRLLLEATVGNEKLVVASPLGGRVPASRLTAAHETFLRRLSQGQTKPVAQTARVCSLRGRDATCPAGHEILRLLDHVMPTLESLALPATIVHRDFAPWNLRQKGGVISAYDWEYAELEGPPLLDAFHHILAVAYFVQRRRPEVALGRLARLARSAPLGLAPGQVRALQVLYLVDHLMTLLDEGYGVEYPKFSWWRQVLVRLTAANG